MKNVDQWEFYSHPCYKGFDFLNLVIFWSLWLAKKIELCFLFVNVLGFLIDELQLMA
jgi:hypothetical protein